jgi:hypothetical protein
MFKTSGADVAPMTGYCRSMTWTTQPKSVGITSTIDHPTAKPLVIGRTLPISEFNFTPAEFYAAAAVCSHMHVVDPLASTPEAEMIASLVKHHVSDDGDRFAILASADNFKDFVKSFFAGAVASGLAYLTMTRSAYHWAGHFEYVAGNVGKERSPDYVFAGQGPGYALMESKGTRSSGRTAFNNEVEEGYLEQVEKHLGKRFNGVVADHGYCIGSWMTSVSETELFVHHTRLSGGSGSAGTPGSPLSGGRRGEGGGGIGESDDDTPPDGGLALVQRHDYATAFSLAFGAVVGVNLRSRLVPDLPPLLRFEWLDRRWLTNPFALGGTRVTQYTNQKTSVRYDAFGIRRAVFAVEEQNVSAVLRYLNEPEGQRGPRGGIPGIEAVPRDLIYRAREAPFCAVLPDGLAVFDRLQRWQAAKLVKWNREKQKFVPVAPTENSF